jgi:hypothetical protein
MAQVWAEEAAHFAGASHSLELLFLLQVFEEVFACLCSSG